MATRCIAAAALALAIGGAALAVTSCADECRGVASCALQPAVRLTITNAASGGPVPNVAVVASGAPVYSTECSADVNASVCTVFGDPGVFTLVVTAPGFHGSQRIVTVSGTAGQCDCVVVNVERVALTLVPTT